MRPDPIKQIHPTKIGTGTAHGKIILMGEHSVVYNHPAIAIPFLATKVEVTVTASAKSESTIASVYYNGPIRDLPESMANVKKAIDLTNDSFKFPNQPLHIDIQSTIPAGRGMGSSAAVAVAIVRALTDYYGQPLTDYQLHLIVNQAEVIAHESTSGIDTLLTSSAHPYIYQKSRQPMPFAMNIDAYLVLADSGIEGQTKLAVGKVRELYEQKPAFIGEMMASISQFVQQGYDAIQNNDVVQLGRLMTYNHYYLNQLEVSDPVLDEIINASWFAGALGAKLTGGGLGGCVIALAKDAESAIAIQERMQAAGAKQTWILNLNQMSGKVE